MRPTLGALSGRGLGPRRVSGGFVLAYSHHLRGMEPEWAELSAAKGPFSAPKTGQNCRVLLGVKRRRNVGCYPRADTERTLLVGGMAFPHRLHDRPLSCRAGARWLRQPLTQTNVFSRDQREQCGELCRHAATRCRLKACVRNTRATPPHALTITHTCPLAQAPSPGITFGRPLSVWRRRLNETRRHKTLRRVASLSARAWAKSAGWSCREATALRHGNLQPAGCSGSTQTAACRPPPRHEQNEQI